MSEIRRIDFIGFTVMGPSSASRREFKPSEWPDWSASLKGNAVILTGSGREAGRSVEIPRSVCVVYFQDTKEPG